MGVAGAAIGALLAALARRFAARTSDSVEPPEHISGRACYLVEPSCQT
jgi:hypothetical protein